MADAGETSILKKLADKRHSLQERVQVLMDKIAVLQSEMNALLQEVARTEVSMSVVREIGGFVRPSDVRAPEAGQRAAKQKTGLTKAGHGNSQAFFEQIAREAFLKSGKPLGTKEVLDAFQALGHEIQGTNPWKQASNNLWTAKRDGRLIHRIGLGYWPADVPNLALGYTPPPGGVPPPLEAKRLKPSKRPKFPEFGVGRPNALTPQQVERIRARRKEGATLAVLAEEFDSSPSTINRYLNDKTLATRREEKSAEWRAKKNAVTQLIKHSSFRRLHEMEGGAGVLIYIKPSRDPRETERAAKEIEKLAKAYMPHVKRFEIVAE
jgi:hypothetical protein